MAKAGKKSKGLPKAQGETTVVGEADDTKAKKPNLLEAIQITMDLAHQGIIDAADPDMEAAAKRQEQAVERVQRFLDRAYPLRKQIKALALRE